MIEPSSLLLVNDHDLRTDLSEFGQSIVRELYLACRKLEGGDVEFSAAQRILDRPLSHLRKWFRLLRVADLECSGPGLRFGGIPLAESAFGSGLHKLLQGTGVAHLVIVPPVSPPELHAFLRALTAEASQGSLARRLAERGVRCLHVNDSEWQARLASRPVPRLDGDGHAMLQDYVAEHWSRAADLVCAAVAGGLPGGERLALRWHCYATPQVLEAVLASHFAALPSQAILEHARRQLEGGDQSAGDTAHTRPPASYWQGLVGAVAHHPYGYELTHALRELLAQHGLPLDMETLLDSQVRLRYEATGVVDELTARVFSTACTVDDLRSWGAAFARLLKAGPSQQTSNLLEALLLHLKRDDREARRKAHFLLGQALAAAAATEEQSIIRWLAERIVADLVAGEETYEFSDLLAGAGELLLSSGQWEALAPVASKLRALQSRGLHPARERVCEAVLERWRQPRWVTPVFAAAEEEQSAAGAVTMLAALGGREVALKAAALITHSQRRVRLAMLEILSGLGDEAVAICEDLIAPEALWRSRGPQGALTDESWYTIRNAFHIMGRVGRDRVMPVLRRHQGDPDSRVRLEVIRALERIGSQEARSALLGFAQDSSVQVKKAAVVALGTVGGEHEVFVLEEFFRADPELAESALLAIGHIGGRAAKDFLFGLLEGEESLLPGPLRPRAEALRDAAMRALIQNPDAEIVARVETFCRNTNRTFRIPLVTDRENDTGRIRLERARGLRQT